MWFRKGNKSKPVRIEMFRDENGFGWRSRTVDKKGVPIKVTDSPLIQFASALRRAQLDDPDLHIYRAEGNKLIRVK